MDQRKLGKQMDQRKLGKQTGMAKAKRHLLAALITLPLLGLVDSSLAAGRVFYDGFESGNTSLWQQDGTRNRCQVVTSAADGVAGPYAGSKMARCNWNGTVAWNDPAAYETLALSSISYSNEVFYRLRIRVDKNLEKTTNSPTKLLRFYSGSPPANDLFDTITGGPSGFINAVPSLTVGGGLATYWGGASGDNTASSTGWHKVETYFNQSTGTIRVWHDGVKVRDDTVSFGGQKWSHFYLTSNWADAHDGTNYIYFDEFEVFSDTGSGATGSMSDASVSGSGSSTPPIGLTPPTNVRVI